MKTDSTGGDVDAYLAIALYGHYVSLIRQAQAAAALAQAPVVGRGTTDGTRS